MDRIARDGGGEFEGESLFPSGAYRPPPGGDGEIPDLLNRVKGSPPPPGGRAPGEASVPEAGIGKLQSLTFGSKEEYVCACLLEAYVPGFKLIPGETFQVRVGTKRLDFKVGRFFIEYHPPRLDHEFTSREHYLELQGVLACMPKWAADEISNLLRREFAGQYAKRRRDLLNCFPETAAAELIVCRDYEEFCRKVLPRVGENLPPARKLIAEFEARLREA